MQLDNYELLATNSELHKKMHQASRRSHLGT